MHIAFDNSYARDLPGTYVAWQPAAVPAPTLLYLNRELAAELGLDAGALASAEGIAMLAGNRVPEGAEPIAQAYAGHQFGGFSPQLGDGRALLLGEVIDRHGRRRDIAFKGSGRTPFSRGGDGKAAVGPMLREVLIGEAMHALGIPTTRALAVAATGFISAGPRAVLPPNLLEEERLRERFNELDDMISTTGVAMMGLTLGCARCHDHKYDPVPRRDYYRLMCAFNAGERSESPLVPWAQAVEFRQHESRWKSEFDAAEKRFKAAEKLKKEREATLRSGLVDKLPISDREKALLKGKPNDTAAKELATKWADALRISDQQVRALLSADEAAELDTSSKLLKELKAHRPEPLPTAFGYADTGPVPRETFLLPRGDFHIRSEPVSLGFLTVLTRNATPEEFWARARQQARRNDTTQQRRAVAEWMTDLEHGAGPLVARVMVNRVWQHHFGQGLVRTVNDFGARSDPPTHPELLEWLADEFVKSGWSLKTLHRRILNSAVYRQDTAHDEAAAKADPENRLLWRRRPMRLEAEILRDSLLAVSGTLNPAMYGPAVKAPITPDAIQARNMKDPYPKNAQDTFATRRRSVYVFHKRVVQQPLMQAFDGPDATISCGRRENTTVAPSGTSSVSCTNTAPALASVSTTWRLCTISWRT